MPDELNEFLESLDELKVNAVDAVKRTIDEEAKEIYESIKNDTPSKTGGLRESLVIVKINNPDRYGYSIEYEGYNEKKVAYAFIGNVLNRGTSKIAPRRQIDKAVRKLKGMDERIFAAYLKMIDKKRR